MDRALSDDAVLANLSGLFPEPTRPRPRRRPRTVVWCCLLVIAGVLATVSGVAGAEALGVGATVAVACGATAIAAGLAFMLAAATNDGTSPGTVWPSTR
jgi:hypothetical protein